VPDTPSSSAGIHTRGRAEHDFMNSPVCNAYRPSTQHCFDARARLDELRRSLESSDTGEEEDGNVPDLQVRVAPSRSKMPIQAWTACTLPLRGEAASDSSEGSVVTNIAERHAYRPSVQRCRDACAHLDELLQNHGSSDIEDEDDDHASHRRGKVARANRAGAIQERHAQLGSRSHYRRPLQARVLETRLSPVGVHGRQHTEDDLVNWPQRRAYRRSMQRRREACERLDETLVKFECSDTLEEDEDFKVSNRRWKVGRAKRAEAIQKRHAQLGSRSQSGLLLQDRELQSSFSPVGVRGREHAEEDLVNWPQRHAYRRSMQRRQDACDRLDDIPKNLESSDMEEQHDGSAYHARETWATDPLPRQGDAQSDSSEDSFLPPMTQGGVASRIRTLGGRLAEHLRGERYVRRAAFRSNSKRSASTSAGRHDVIPSGMISSAVVGQAPSSSSLFKPRSTAMPPLVPRKAW